MRPKRHDHCACAFEAQRDADLIAERERYLAFEVRGSRYNLGMQYGLLVAQLALGLAGQDRAEILAQVVELLARQGT